MTIIETTVTMSINQKGLTLEEMEAQIGDALQQAGRDLLIQVCQVMEAQVLEERAELRRSKRRGLHLLTRFGWIRLKRWQMRDAQGRFFCPLDQVLGLQPRQHASPWITQQAVALATRLPYRQATYLLSTFINEAIDHRSMDHTASCRPGHAPALSASHLFAVYLY
jgi:hypothetical protein